MVNQLIIIGNGFDLHCDLKSSYEDYFNDRYINNRYTDNFWDYYFRLLKSISLNNKVDIEEDKWKWSDVEERINNFLICNKNKLYKQFTDYRIIGLISNCLNIEKNNLKNSNINSYLQKKQFEIASDKKLNIFLLDELRIFENNFCEYMRNLFASTDEYSIEGASIKYTPNNNQSNNLLIDYISKFKKNIDLISENKAFNLLDFNYTFYGEPNTSGHCSKLFKGTFTNISKCNYKNCNKYLNIHGDLTADIIFGIDGYKISSNDPRFIFTKNNRLNRQYKSKLDTICTKDINTIKFYGHSLSDSDYSYFKYLFDKFNLSDKNIYLIFYYNIFNNKSKEKCINDLSTNVQHLLDKYHKGLYNDLVNDKKIVFQELK